MRRPRTSDPVEYVQEEEDQGEACEPDPDRGEVVHEFDGRAAPLNGD
jgi:hypothetical protein